MGRQRNSGRGQKQGRSRSRSVNRRSNNNKRSFSKKRNDDPSKKEDLKDHKCYVGSTSNASEYVTNINFIINHIELTFAEAADMAQALKDGKEFEFDKVRPKMTDVPPLGSNATEDEQRARTRAIDEWKAQKGVQGNSFLISRSIKRRGLRATNFISNAVDQKTLDDFANELAEILAIDIQIKISPS